MITIVLLLLTCVITSNPPPPPFPPTHRLHSSRVLPYHRTADVASAILLLAWLSQCWTECLNHSMIHRRRNPFYQVWPCNYWTFFFLMFFYFAIELYAVQTEAYVSLFVCCLWNQRWRLGISWRSDVHQRKIETTVVCTKDILLSFSVLKTRLETCMLEVRRRQRKHDTEVGHEKVWSLRVLSLRRHDGRLTCWRSDVHQRRHYSAAGYQEPETGAVNVGLSYDIPMRPRWKTRYTSIGWYCCIHLWPANVVVRWVVWVKVKVRVGSARYYMSNQTKIACRQRRETHS